MSTPGFFPHPLSIPTGLGLDLLQLDEFLAYLKRHKVKEVFWQVVRAQEPDGEVMFGPMARFNPGVHFALRLTAKDQDMIVSCYRKFPFVLKLGEVKTIRAQVEKIKQGIKRKGFLLLEGSLGTPTWAGHDVWDIEELLKPTKESHNYA